MRRSADRRIGGNSMSQPPPPSRKTKRNPGEPPPKPQNQTKPRRAAPKPQNQTKTRPPSRKTKRNQSGPPSQAANQHETPAGRSQAAKLETLKLVGRSIYQSAKPVSFGVSKRIAMIGSHSKTTRNPCGPLPSCQAGDKEPGGSVNLSVGKTCFLWCE